MGIHLGFALCTQAIRPHSFGDLAVAHSRGSSCGRVLVAVLALSREVFVLRFLWLLGAP